MSVKSGLTMEDALTALGARASELSTDELLDAIGVVIEDASRDVEIVVAIAYRCHRHYEEILEFDAREIQDSIVRSGYRALVVGARTRSEDARGLLVDAVRRHLSEVEYGQESGQVGVGAGSR